MRSKALVFLLLDIIAQIIDISTLEDTSILSSSNAFFGKPNHLYCGLAVSSLHACKQGRLLGTDACWKKYHENGTALSACRCGGVDFVCALAYVPAVKRCFDTLENVGFRSVTSLFTDFDECSKLAPEAVPGECAPPNEERLSVCATELQSASVELWEALTVVGATDSNKALRMLECSMIAMMIDVKGCLFDDVKNSKQCSSSPVENALAYSCAPDSANHCPAQVMSMCLVLTTSRDEEKPAANSYRSIFGSTASVIVGMLDLILDALLQPTIVCDVLKNTMQCAPAEHPKQYNCTLGPSTLRRWYPTVYNGICARANRGELPQPQKCIRRLLAPTSSCALTTWKRVFENSLTSLAFDISPSFVAERIRDGVASFEAHMACLRNDSEMIRRICPGATDAALLYLAGIQNLTLKCEIEINVSSLYTSTERPLLAPPWFPYRALLLVPCPLIVLAIGHFYGWNQHTHRSLCFPNRALPKHDDKYAYTSPTDPSQVRGHAWLDLAAMHDYSKLPLLIDQSLLIDFAELVFDVNGIIPPGHFADVEKATFRGQPCAVKRMRTRTIECSSTCCGLVRNERTILASRSDCRHFVSEGLLMVKFDHPNVLPLIGIGFDPAMRPLIVTPYMCGGDLRTYLRKGERELNTEKKLRFSLQIAEGMRYLHTLHILHRDLAARNCLLNDAASEVKIADFGLARSVDVDETYISLQPGAEVPMLWMAPESILLNVYDYTTDVWSFGVTIWELFSRAIVPYTGVTLSWVDFVAALDRGKLRLSRPADCPTSVYDLLSDCWKSTSSARPSIDSVAQRLRSIQSAVEFDADHA